MYAMCNLCRVYVFLCYQQWIVPNQMQKRKDEVEKIVSGLHL